jgi:hypothetical protein
VYTRFPNGTSGYVCPQALVFSVGFDSDMVLQQAPAKAAVYGEMVGGGDGASVSVTVSPAGGSGGSSYTVKAVLSAAPTYCLPNNPTHLTTSSCAANYSASWKAYLKPTPAGGDYSITAVCTGCGTEDSSARSTSSIHRVTFGDVYFCSGRKFNAPWAVARF